jgi:hypothetical protein
MRNYIGLSALLICNYALQAMDLPQPVQSAAPMMHFNTHAATYPNGDQLEIKYMNALAVRLLIPYALKKPTDSKSQFIKRYTEQVINKALMLREQEERHAPDKSLDQIDEIDLALDTIERESYVLTRIANGRLDTQRPITAAEFRRQWQEIKQQIAQETAQSQLPENHYQDVGGIEYQSIM